MIYRWFISYTKRRSPNRNWTLWGEAYKHKASADRRCRTLNHKFPRLMHWSEKKEIYA